MRIGIAPSAGCGCVRFRSERACRDGRWIHITCTDQCRSWASPHDICAGRAGHWKHAHSTRSRLGKYSAHIPRGISVTLQQGSNRPVGILDVRPVSTCGPSSRAGTGIFPQPISNCGRLTAVTVQIPLDIVTICSVCFTPPSEYAPTILWVTEEAIHNIVRHSAAGGRRGSGALRR